MTGTESLAREASRLAGEAQRRARRAAVPGIVSAALGVFALTVAILRATGVL